MAANERQNAFCAQQRCLGCVVCGMGDAREGPPSNPAGNTLTDLVAARLEGCDAAYRMRSSPPTSTNACLHTEGRAFDVWLEAMQTHAARTVLLTRATA